MRRSVPAFVWGVVLGLLLAGLLAPPASTAQAPGRLFGTDSTGRAVPIGVTGDALKVTAQ